MQRVATGPPLPLPQPAGAASLSPPTTPPTGQASAPMDVILVPLLNIISTVISIYIWIIIIGAILSWLVTFNVVNTTNRFVYMVGDICYRLTEPALRPIRNFLPNLGGIDLSPVVLILILIFARDVLRGIVYAGY